jgi:hypothetical protein
MIDKAKREGSLKVPMKFDDAIKHALQVKSPKGGWSAYEKTLRLKRRQPIKRGHELDR